MARFAKTFLLSILIQGYLLYGSSAWHVKMPSSIKGLKGSCLVIPCSFDYYRYPPSNPNRVVWYQYVSRGYPLVYDSQNSKHVIEKFRGRTRRVGSMYKKECSLEIFPLEWSHHREKIYPWVDPENVGRRTYAFFDRTVIIEVVGRAETPVIQIIGNLKVRQEVTVHCSVSHTCPSYPPTLSLNIPLKNPKLTHEPLSGGTFKTTLMTTLVIENDHQTVECSVRHTGGLSAKASKSFDAKCSFWPLTISPQSEFLEGNERKVTCSVYYTCFKHMPTLTWNYESMPASTKVKTTEATLWRSVSTLTFTTSAKDHGKSLTCYAHFTGGQTQETSITLQVKRAMWSRGWSFTTPGSITGMRGSCVVIPCSFTYTRSQPAGLTVIWYLYQSHGHPAVFNQRQSITDKFRDRTSLVGSVNQGNCSLQIERLEMSHNQDRLYPWIDTNPITSYHTLGQNYYDKTSQLVVSDSAQQPQVNIIGIPRVGEQSSVSCSVHHTCPSAPPTLTLNDLPGADLITHTAMSNGIWETTVERTWNIREEDQSVACTVMYPGGQKATTEVKLNVECRFEEIRMDEEPGELTEGVAKNVICSVSYKCKKDTPTMTWNYKDMQSSVHTKEVSKNTYNTMSNLTFIASLGDNDKLLTCTAQFMHGQTSASTHLRIKKYEKSIEEIYLHENDTFHVLAADVPSRVSALARSCVVVPCSFQGKDETITNLRGIWYNRAGGFVYHNGQSQVLNHFKGRTRILGDLNQQNCTLEIDDIKPFDNGPFCFRAERRDDKYHFNNSCVFIVMRASPERPAITPIPADVDAGSAVNVTCSVTHTCPSHPPLLSWNVLTLTTEVKHTWMGQGIWETSSVITFMPTGGDGVKNLTCTALFWRGSQQASTVRLNVKGSLMFQLRGALPIVAPVSIVALFVIILATVLGVSMWRKRGHSDNSLRPPPRPEKRRSLRDRLSSRYHEHRQRPPRPETGKAIGNRFSRHQGNTANLSVGFLSNTKTVDIQMSKQRFPSPKDNQRYSARPVVDSTEDYNVYSNV